MALDYCFLCLSTAPSNGIIALWVHPLTRRSTSNHLFSFHIYIKKNIFLFSPSTLADILCEWQTISNDNDIRPPLSYIMRVYSHGGHWRSLLGPDKGVLYSQVICHRIKDQADITYTLSVGALLLAHSTTYCKAFYVPLS